MIGLVLDIASWILFVTGGLAVLTGGIGVLRLPDVYTRMHGASVTDTMGAGLFVLGMILQAPDWLVAVKLALILVFLAFTGPTSTFALAHAAITSNVRPILADGTGDGAGEDENPGESWS
jgi:multicomponent Na+:H+ antiporter subunit G